MMQSANNGHSHGSHPSAASHYPPHLDPRYMEYANMAHHHPGVVDPHLHYGLPPASLPQSHVGGSALKRNADSAGLDMMGGTPSSAGGVSSDEDSDIKPPLGDRTAGTGRGKSTGPDPATGKKTKGRVKIKMEFIDNKLRRYTTFSKRKTGIMKKAYELSTLTGTQVMLLVASETGHVYTFATRKLQPMITSDAGKALIQTCLNSPDPMPPGTSVNGDQRMSATGYEETELTYNIAAAADEEQQQKTYDPNEMESDDESEHDAEEDGEALNPHQAPTWQRIEPQTSRSRAQYPRLPTLTRGKGGADKKTTVHPVISTMGLPMVLSSPSASITVVPAHPNPNRANLPPEMINQLMQTGHMITPQGTLIRIPMTQSFQAPSPMIFHTSVPGSQMISRLPNSGSLTILPATTMPRFPSKPP